jgi:hypothetical protein
MDAWRLRVSRVGPRLLAARRPGRPHPEPAPRLDREAALVEALQRLRLVVESAAFPLALPGAEPARAQAAALLADIDDHLVPRLRRVNAPLLAVLGGSTGAGKSTLINSLVRAPISPAGVLRPTTRTPVLLCHPTDAPWFAEREVLPGLRRASQPGEETLQIVNAPSMVAGLALLDAPDVDSVDATNRSRARQILAAGDLWLFVTTAVRYADAVPWRLMREARDRGTTIAVVLSRVPVDTGEEIACDFVRLLAGQGLGEAPLFVIPESDLDGQGLLAEADVADTKRWIDSVASSAPHRRHVARRTLLGAVASVDSQVADLARAAQDQTDAAAALAASVRAAFGAAVSDVELRLRGGAMLRGEVYSRWQELLANGDLRLALKATAGPRRSQLSTGLAERPVPGRRFHAGLAAALADLIVEVDATAAQRCRERWQATQAGQELLAADPTLGRPWLGFADAAFALVHGWQSWLRAMVRADAHRVRTQTRSYTTAAQVLLSTVAAVAPPVREITASGTGPAMLRAVGTHRAALALGERARLEFVSRVGSLLNAEVDRRLNPIAQAGTDPGLATRLRDAATEVRLARSALTTGLGDAA